MKNKKRKLYRDLKAIGVNCHLPKDFIPEGLKSSTKIITGMNWSATKQGEDFWYKVYTQLKEKGL